MRQRRRSLIALGLVTVVAIAGGCAPNWAPSAADDTATTTVAATVDDPSATIAPTTAVAGSTTLPAPPAADDEPVPFAPEPIEWEPLNETVDVGWLEVPYDYDDPDGPRFELYVARFNALDQDDKLGALLANPGGPGFGGANQALYAPQIFDEELLRRFDIIGWDPRGSGESRPPIDCIDDYDTYFSEVDGTPDDETEREAYVASAQAFARACVDNNGATLGYVGTNNSARDIDSIRRALGEARVSYFGRSAGSELGAVWATLFPETVRAAVLDGAADPDADGVESSLQQLRGFQASLEAFLAACSDDDDCAFHNDGDAEAAFVELMEELDAEPLVVDDDRPPVNRDVATTGVLNALYSQSYWPALERSLADAADGDGDGLLALHDAYYRRNSDGTWGNELEAFQVITCADTAERQTVDEADAEVELFAAAAPLIVPEGSVGGYFCTFFPEPIDPRIEVTGDGAGPIVVIGTTGDPATPLASTERMADALEDGRLVVVEAERHTGYGVNRCIVDLVNRYLVDLESPDDGTECR